MVHEESDPFDGRLGFGRRPGLVVVDMVNAYTDPDCALYLGNHVHDTVGSISRLVEAARSASVPVIYTSVEVSEDGSANGIFFRKVPAISIFRDPHFGGLVGELDPLASETVIMKHYPSALCGTSLAPMLLAGGVDSMVICGVSTSGCIRATATDAMQHGFVPLVVREAVADRDPATHESNLFDIDAKVGDVVSEAATLEHFALR